ncbi:DUF2141 domain-containing protein [Pseudohaliea sp.]|uniref:DUF2141 domain-containing protein n=1 Tax=Pseudohaliea sp. TaxID=2740289 RepID=UPI0032ED99DC
MKKLIVAASVTTALVQQVAAADLGLLVENITDPQGTLLWSVFDSAEAFAADTRPVVSARSRVTGNKLRVTLHDLPAGVYAIKLYHDANGNGELDTNMLGIPVEGYGFSNNAGRRGPASFEDASVAVDRDTQITIRLR